MLVLKRYIPTEFMPVCLSSELSIADILLKSNPLRLVARAGFAPAFRGYEPLVCPTLLPRREKLVRVAGIEPAWTCSQGMWVAANLHPEIRGSSWSSSTAWGSCP